MPNPQANCCGTIPSSCVETGERDDDAQVDNQTELTSGITLSLSSLSLLLVETYNNNRFRAAYLSD